MYVWQEVRKACPLDLSPSYSFGNARGGGHVIGTDRTGVTLTGGVFGSGGMLMCGVHARGILRGNQDGGVFGEVQVGGESGLGSFLKRLQNHIESALWGDPILM